jgi:alkanesulfonate monooxygenase
MNSDQDANELRFHWGSALDDGQKKSAERYDFRVLDLDGAIDFAREADSLGVESLLMAQSYDLPDPIPLLGALVRETRNVTFILAYRPGLLSPTLFGQMVNTLSWMSEGRIALNLISGISPVEQGYYGDFLAHDGRHERTREFLQVLHGLWREEGPVTFGGEHYRIEEGQLGLPYYGGGRPEIYVSGASQTAQDTAVDYGDCWFRYGDTPEKIAQEVQPLLARRGRVGLRMQVLARPTREEALADLAEVMGGADEAHREWVAQFVAAADSQAVKNSFRLADEADHGWMSPMLWSGAVAYRGGPALCIVGDYDEVADYLLRYKQAGVSEFIFSGWPARDEMNHFFTHVVPRVRIRERAGVPAGVQ